MCSHESPGKIPEFQSSLRCHRLTLPRSPSVFAVGADICNHWSHPFTCVCVSYKKTTRGSPRPPKSRALPEPLLWQLRKPRPEQVWCRKCCYLLGYQHGTLGPEAQQLLRGGEGQEGGDVCRRRGGQDRSWFLGDRWHRWLCRGPDPDSLPRTYAPHAGQSRLRVQNSPKFPKGGVPTDAGPGRLLV